MIRGARQFAAKYYLLVGSAAGLIVGLILRAGGLKTIDQWFLAVVALAAAVILLLEVIDNLRQGYFSAPIILVMAIVLAVILRQFATALVLPLLGEAIRLINNIVLRRAGASSQKLIDLELPKTVKLIKAGQQTEVPLADFSKGDVFSLAAGEIVPLDGVIINGEATIDEANLIVRSEPGYKSVGDKILAGSVNLDGALTVRADNTSDANLLKTIKRMAKAAASSRAPLTRLTDIFSLPYLGLVIFVALTVGLVNHSGLRSLEVLSAATMAPLVLVAPLGFIAGLNQLARRGVFVESAAKLENLALAKTIIFAKNGTLNDDKFSLETIKTYAGFTKHEVLKLAASLEQDSNHILAAPIIQAAIDRQLKIIRAKNVLAFSAGLSAKIQQDQILLGSAKFLKDSGVVLAKDVDNLPETCAMLAVGQRLAAVFKFTSEIRPEAAETISELKSLGLKNLLILTGDSLASAQLVSKDLAIKGGSGELTPAEKILAVENMQPRPVVYLGARPNDLAAMASAEVGVAFNGRCHNLARESAAAIIVESDLEYLALGVAIAKKTVAATKQTIIFGLILSLGLLIIFASGWFTAIFGAVIQAAIAVIIILATWFRLKN